jgi:hypothetical protein
VRGESLDGKHLRGLRLRQRGDLRHREARSSSAAPSSPARTGGYIVDEPASTSNCSRRSRRSSGAGSRLRRGPPRAPLHVAAGPSGTSLRGGPALRHPERARPGARARSSPTAAARRRGRQHAHHPGGGRAAAARPVSRSPRARRPTPAAWPPPRSRCSRTPAATRGPSSHRGAAARRSCGHPRAVRRDGRQYGAPGRLRGRRQHRRVPPRSPTPCWPADGSIPIEGALNAGPRRSKTDHIHAAAASWSATQLAEPVNHFTFSGQSWGLTGTSCPSP